jgi:D-alanyl-D-alanine carboxypeptidase (penicillin-binding protein 5/6)
MTGRTSLSRRSRRLTAVLVALLALALLSGCGETLSAPFATPTAPAPTATPSIPRTPAPKIAARSAFLMNALTGEVYLSVNAETSVAMASTTKIMTALAAIQFSPSLDVPVKVGADAVAMNTNGNSVAFLRLGDTITLREALYALLLPSGDDAAVAIADAVAGSTPRFVGLMNLEASLLGMRHTSYLNVSGLDPDDGSNCARGHGNCSSARDLTLLAEYAMANADFHTVVSTPHYVLQATTLHRDYTWDTTNNLLVPKSHYDGIEGVKTGHTEDAGYCLVFEAAHSDRRLVGVVLGDKTDAGRFTDATALLDWGFGAQ